MGTCSHITLRADIVSKIFFSLNRTGKSGNTIGVRRKQVKRSFWPVTGIPPPGTGVTAENITKDKILLLILPFQPRDLRLKVLGFSDFL